MTYIIIGADIVPTKSNLDYFVDNRVYELLDEETSLFLKKAHYRIFNLEVPLVDTIQPIVKEGPCLSAPTKVINGIKSLDIDLMTLANNHILDQGDIGLSSTLNCLDSCKINHIGAGANIFEAQKPFFISFNNKTVAVYACAEHEFSIAGYNDPGANPFDPLKSFDEIKSIKSKSDYLIILYHGGKEHYRYPSPGLQKICHKFVESGADLVVCQHSHCVGCMEKYLAGQIIYGQGNFIFDYSDNECWQTSILIGINDDFCVEFFPIQKNGKGIKKGSEKIVKEFLERSEKIKDEEFVKNEYNEFSRSLINEYLYAFAGYHSFLFRLINRISHGNLLKMVNLFKYKRRNMNRILNYIECESHRELIINAIKEYRNF